MSLNDEALARVTAVKNSLTPREKTAYEFTVKSKQAPIARSTSDKMYSLFLAGKTCDEISTLNPGFPLGQIVRARIDDRWDERKTEHQTHLLTTTKERATQTHLESVHLLADMLTATNKLWGEKIKRFLQTGDEAELQNFPIKSFKDLKELMELMLKATGQDKNSTVSGKIVHEHNVNHVVDGEVLEEDQAASVLEFLDKKVIKK